ncbi:DUF4258 domain-containing protein [Candidatus Woesearchaeota archaeon]|nr:DUF4258 domain-containing protein [Candidatus Woesearchaeota archaeon]
MKVRFTAHAAEQMVARGICLEEVKRAIRRGSTFKQAPDKYVAVFAYFSVVYRIIDNEHYIITVQPYP